MLGDLAILLGGVVRGFGGFHILVHGLRGHGTVITLFPAESEQSHPDLTCRALRNRDQPSTSACEAEWEV